MNTKANKTVLLVLQIIITLTVMLVDVCGIVSLNSINESELLIESFIRCVATLVFSVFYYKSVSGSFGSDSLIFPLYLLFLSVSETRIIETVARILNLFLIPQRYIIFTLVFSSFMLSLSLISYALLPNGSKKESDIYIYVSVVASLFIACYGPNAQVVSETWNSRTLVILYSLFSLLGIAVAVIQVFSESFKSSKIKYVICILMLINNYINLMFNTSIMNTIGTALYVVSVVVIMILVKINSTRL